jgi:CheY-like chemotaxis protein
MGGRWRPLRRIGDAPPLVSVVDDDESVRESLPDLLRELGFAVQAFSSAQEFLVRPRALTPSCLVLDVSMPGESPPRPGDEKDEGQVSRRSGDIGRKTSGRPPEAAARSGPDYQGAGL